MGSGLFQGVEGAADGVGAALEDMGVYHGGADVFVAEEFLDGADVVAAFQQVGGEGVPQHMGGDVFGDACFAGGLTDGFLDAAGVQVVAAEQAAARVGGEVFGGEEVLPFPTACRGGVFAFQSVGEGDPLPAGVFQVAGVNAARPLNLDFEVGLEGFGEQGGAVFVAFAAAHEDVVVFEVDILDAEAEGFGEAQPAAVEELGNQPGGAIQEGHQTADFFPGEHGGKALRAFGEGVVEGRGEFLLEDVAVEEEQGAEGLVLG